MNYLKNCKNCYFILIFFLIYIFYIFGLMISDLIDFHFDEMDLHKRDQYLMIEIIIEFGFAYLIRVIFETYQTKILDPLFNVFNSKTPEYMNLIIPLAFIFGVYQNLKKGNSKMLYFVEKYAPPSLGGKKQPSPSVNQNIV